jgi:hypothetical protein
VSQNLNDWVTFNPGKSVSDFIAEQPEALAETAIATIMGASIQAGLIHGAQRATGQFQQMQEERRTKQLQETLTSLFEEAKGIKSDPVTFQSFMAGTTDNASVFINADALQETLAQSKIDPAIIPSLAEQLAQPSVTGDVEIPIGELMTAFAGTPGQEQIVQHARIRQDDLSAAEQAEFGDIAAFFKKQGAAVAERQKDNEQFVSERQEIEASIVEQLGQASPFGQREHRYYAQMMGAFYSTAAELMGTTPKQIQARWAPNILGATDTAQPTSTLSQGFDHGNAMLNVGLDVGATDRAQKIDADFVKAEIEKLGVQVLSAKEVQGEYEYEGKMVQELTYVPQLSRPLTEAEVNQLAIATGQEAIGQYDNGTGNLWGPNAANWGSFNPEFFKDQVGTKLSDAQKAELAQKKTPAKKKATAKPIQDAAAVTEAASIANANKIAATGKFDYIRDLKEQLQNAVRAAAQGADLSATTSEVRKYLADLGTQEALAALQTNSNAVGWYDEKTRQALSVVALVHPEILTDPDARFTFIYALAVTSNGQRVEKNFELAERAYASWKESKGTMPSEVGAGGPAGKKVHEALARYNDLVAKFGSPSAVEKFMLTEFTAKELAAAGFDAGGENVDTVVLGAALLGPKIGNGFFANLYGVFDRLTMDRWLMRTWGRWTGTLLKDNQVAVNDEKKVLKALVRAVRADKEANAAMRQVFAMSVKGEVDKALLTAKASPWEALAKSGNLEHLSDQLKLKSTYPPLRKVMQSSELLDQLRKSGNRLAGKLDGSNEAPGGGNQRNWIRAVFSDILQNVVESTGQNMEMADLQALLWYPEKRLYDSAKSDDELGGYEDDEAPDYANAAVALARSKGVSNDAIAAALAAALARPADRPAAVRPVAGPAVAGELGNFADEAAEIDGQEGELAQAVRNAGAVAGPVVGVHYSKAPRTTLASSMAGQGMKGAEAERIAASKDPRIKQRVNFYVNTGNGITPESDVGSNPHVATLRNLYDADADALKIWRNSKGDMNVAESAVLDAGFDGYLTRNFGNQGAVVMLGNRNLDVEGISREDVATRAEQPPSAEIPKMKQAAMAIMQNRALANGRQSVASWKRDIERSDPDTAALIAWDKIPAGDYYKDQIAGQLWQTKWFYSALQRAIEGAPAKVFSTGKATAQWLSANAGKMAVKKQEIEATGITDWLQTRDRVTREDVAAYLEQGGVQLTETVLADGEPTWFVRELGKVLKRGFATEQEAIDWADENAGPTARVVENDERTGGAKFSDYQLPGGENYREWLLTLPNKAALDAQQLERREMLRTMHVSGEQMLPREIAELQTLEAGQTDKGAFKSSHFDQPNILAHIRTNERTDVDGKRVLFIEEIQSDWAQKGRKEGFLTPDTHKAERERIKNEMSALQEKARKNREAGVDGAGIAEAVERLDAQLRKIPTPTGTPSAPFVTDTKSWTALALKRMIAHAVEQGFDSVAWTTGEQQAARYDLSKHVGSISYMPVGDGFSVTVWAPNDDTVWQRNNATASEIEDTLGKEIAQKMVAREGAPRGDTYTLSGLDLKVGGEGMKGYYDGIVPQVANDVLKKLGGGRVETVTINLDHDASGNEQKEWNEGAVRAILREGGEVYAVERNDETNISTEEDLAEYLEDNTPTAYVLGDKQGSRQQPGFTITPAMREAVGQGLPLFAEAAGPRRGSFNPLTFDLRLLADANRSTFIHEASHFFMAAYIDMASQPDAPPALKQYVEDLLGYLFKNVPGGEQVGGEGLGQPVGPVPREQYNAADAANQKAWGEYYDAEDAKKGQEVLAPLLAAAEATDAELLRLRRKDVAFERAVLASEKEAKLAEIKSRPDKGAGYNWYEWEPDTRVRSVSEAQAEIDALRPPPDLAQEVGADNTASGAIPEGRTNLERWNAMTLDQQRAYWEFFAEGFEQYAMSGKAPTKALQSAFNAFAKWMKEIYKTLKAFVMQHGTKPLDAELTQYFDRMLATDEELDAARAERGFQALFKNLAESGMSPGQFADYMALDELQKTEAEELLRARSIRDMKWLSGAKSRAIAEIQSEADELRNLVRASVEEELANTPIRQVEKWLKKGAMKVGGDEIQATAGHRLDMAVLKAMFPEGAIAGQIDFAKLGRGANALASSTGTQHPDDVAALANEQFGGAFRNGEDLVRQLIEMPSFTDEAAHLTDLRMLEEHGDLATPEAIAKAADVAIHNDAHLKMLATELWALNNRTGSVAALAKAAKAFAQNLVDNTVVKKLRPVQFVNAATRAGKASVRAHGKGELDKAATEKRTEVVNAAAAKAAYAAEAEVRAIINRLRKVSAYSDKHSSVTTREFSVVQAVRAILSEFDIGSKGEKAGKYLELVQEYDPTLGAVLDATIKQLAPVAKPWDQLKVAELRELREYVEGLWTLARETRSAVLGGEKLTLDEARARLKAQLEKTAKAGRHPGSDYAITDAEKRSQDFMSAVSGAVRPETWFKIQDGLDDYGDFTQLLWNTIEDGQTALDTARAEKLKQVQALLKPVIADMQDVEIDAKELGYTFGKGGVPGYAELLHAIIHTGTVSNMERLLLIPRHKSVAAWGSQNPDGSLNTAKWDAFMARMYREGRITQKHMDFVQGFWNLMESLKEPAQKTHRSMTGKFFTEIAPRGIVTPFGTYPGGYAPAIADPRLSPAAKAQQALDADAQDALQLEEKPWAGFAKERSSSAVAGRPLELNLGVLQRHVDSVLVFTHMSVPVRDVRRVLRNTELQDLLADKNDSAMNSIIRPWLHSAAKQTVIEQGKWSWQDWQIWSNMRSRGGVAQMVFNVSNSAQQFTGYFPALSEVDGKELMFAAGQNWHKPSELAKLVSEMSPYMRSRLDNEIHALRNEIEQIILNPSLFEKGQDAAMRYGYFLQTAVDIQMSPTIWLAKYNETMAEGKGKTLDADALKALDKKAKHLADSAVRMTQGSNRPIDVASFEKGSPFYRLFTQYLGWFNGQANLLGMKLARDRMLPPGAQRYGRMTMHLGLIWWAPAIAATIIAVGLRGGPDDEDGDGVMDDWVREILLGIAKYALGAAPFLGQAATMGINNWNDKPYDDRLPTAPIVSLLEAGGKGLKGAYDSLEDPQKAGRAIRDLGSFFSLVTGVPITPATKAIGFATDVETGKVSPTGPVDYGRGIITGVASPESKAR